MIYIIRHGETEWNRAHLLQGRSDQPLNQNGIAQAEEAAAWFRKQGIVFSRIISSPLQRAVETGRIIAGETADIEIDERLLEMDYGPYEGMDLKNPYPEVLSFFQDFIHTPAPDGMEQLPDVVARMGCFVKELESGCRGKEEETILISTHAIAMKGILEYLTPESKGAFWNTFLGNCALYRTWLEEDTFRIPEEVPRQEYQ